MWLDRCKGISSREMRVQINNPKSSLDLARDKFGGGRSSQRMTYRCHCVSETWHSISDKDSLARTLKFIDASSVYNVKLAAWTICDLRRLYVVSKGQDNTKRQEIFGIIIPTDVGQVVRLWPTSRQTPQRTPCECLFEAGPFLPHPVNDRKQFYFPCGTVCLRKRQLDVLLVDLNVMEHFSSSLESYHVVINDSFRTCDRQLCESGRSAGHAWLSHRSHKNIIGYRQGNI